MENKLQAGFELIGKVFGKRLADVGMYFLLSLGAIVATILPIVGILGFAMIQNLSDPSKLQEMSRFGTHEAIALLGSIFGALVLMLLISAILRPFVAAFGIGVVKVANDDSRENMQSAISLAVANWGRMIGLSLLSGLLVFVVAMAGYFALIIIGLIFGLADKIVAAVILILGLLIGFFWLLWWISPLYMLAPLEVMLTKNTVTMCMSNALSKSRNVRAPLFWINICFGLASIALALLISLARIPFLSTILDIPLALILVCLAYPYYLEYSKQFVEPVADTMPDAKTTDEAGDDKEPKSDSM